MENLRIPHNALVLVCDGEKALFLRNQGTAMDPELVISHTLTQDNPPSREQGTDRPGRSSSSASGQRSAMEPTDWHELGKSRFAAKVVDTLERASASDDFGRLVLVAPPHTLGELRAKLSAQVTERVLGEVNKTLTQHPVSEIQRLLTHS